MNPSNPNHAPTPKALSNWFVVHFVVDMVVAIPLMFFPVFTLRFLVISEISDATLLLARIVAAAFTRSGIESLLGRNAAPQTMKEMLNLKIIWSLSATIGIVWSILQTGSYQAAWMAVVFLTFNFLWIYWRLRIGKLLSRE